MYDAVGLVRERWDSLTAPLSLAASAGEAEEVITNWTHRLGQDQELIDLLFRTGMKARMAGALFVQDFEVPDRANKSRSLQASPPDTFLNLSFPEAVEHFNNRGVVSPEVFANMLDQERQNAFTASQVTTQTIRERMHADLLREMGDDAEGLEAFQEEYEEAVESELIRQDFESQADFQVRRRRLQRLYLENVFRTSTASSYAAGRYEKQTDPEVIEQTGYWQYSTANDNRVRGLDSGDKFDHVQLHGKQWKIGDAEGTRVYPPNGYQCRCAIYVIDEEDVNQEALNRPIDVSTAVQPGFDGVPTGT